MKTVLTRILWGILSMAMSSVGLSQCTLTVLESPAVHDPNLTTFRFYINLEMRPGECNMGDNYDHLVIHAPQGVFNSAFNSSWNASGINPVFVAVFPEVADDTYATIGLDGPAQHQASKQRWIQQSLKMRLSQSPRFSWTTVPQNLSAIPTLEAHGTF